MLSDLGKPWKSQEVAALCLNETTATYLAAVVLSQFGLPYSARSSSINRMGCERVVIHMLFDSLKDTLKRETKLTEVVKATFPRCGHSGNRPPLSGLKSNGD
jgi:hypothetical protein